MWDIVQSGKLYARLNPKKLYTLAYRAACLDFLVFFSLLAVVDESPGLSVGSMITTIGCEETVESMMNSFQRSIILSA